MEEEINPKELIRKIDPHYVRVAIIVLLILMSLFVGHRVGYIQGFTKIQNWYDNYINKSCFCQIEPPKKYELVIPEDLGGSYNPI